MTINNIPGLKAQIPNPALKAFDILIGEWKTIGTHPALPHTTLHGHASFKWIEGGAFLLWYSSVDQAGFPAGVAIFGSDDALNAYFMLYFDERKVSRMQEVSFKNNVLKWWRNAPGHSQRYTWTFEEDGNSFVSRGELSKDGVSWEKDLDQTFVRIP